VFEAISEVSVLSGFPCRSNSTHWFCRLKSRSFDACYHHHHHHHYYYYSFFFHLKTLFLIAIHCSLYVLHDNNKQLFVLCVAFSEHWQLCVRRVIITLYKSNSTCWSMYGARSHAKSTNIPDLYHVLCVSCAVATLFRSKPIDMSSFESLANNSLSVSVGQQTLQQLSSETKRLSTYK